MLFTFALLSSLIVSPLQVQIGLGWFSSYLEQFLQNLMVPPNKIKPATLLRNILHQLHVKSKVVGGRIKETFSMPSGSRSRHHQ